MRVGQRERWVYVEHPPKCDRVFRRTRQGVVISETRCDNDSVVVYLNGSKRCSDHYKRNAKIAAHIGPRFVTAKKLLETLWR